MNERIQLFNNVINLLQCESLCMSQILMMVKDITANISGALLQVREKYREMILCSLTTKKFPNGFSKMFLLFYQIYNSLR